MTTLNPTVTDVPAASTVPLVTSVSIPEQKVRPPIFTNREIASIYASTLSVMRYTANATKEFFGVSKDHYMFPQFRLVAIVPIVLTIENLAKTILSAGEDCVHAVKVSASEAIDIALNIIGDIGSILDNIATVADGLAAVEVVAIEAIKWSTPLLFVSLGLEALGMAVHVKAFVEIHLFSNKLSREASLEKPAEQYSLNDYKMGMAAIEQEQKQARTFTGKQFACNEEKLMARLHAIEQTSAAQLESPNPEEKAAAQKAMHSTMKTLKDRLVTTQLSQAISTVATTVAIIGVLLLFTPAAPVGFALLAATTVTSIANLVNRKIQLRHFEEALQI